MGEGLKGTFSQITGAIATVRNAMSVFIAALAIHEIEKVIGVYTRFVEEVHKLSVGFGTSLEEATTFNIALREIGLNADEVGTMLRRLVMHVKENEDSFTRLGVKVKDENTGAMLPALEIFKNTIDRLRDYKAGLDRTEAASDLFGMRVNNVNQLLRLTNEQMAHAEEVQKKLGITVGEDGVKQMHKYEQATADLKLTWTVFSGEIATLILPKFIKFTDWVVNTAVPALSRLKDIIYQVRLAFAGAEGVLGGGGATRTWGAPTAEGEKGLTYVPKPKKVEAGAGTETSRMQEWETEYAEILNKAMEDEGAWVEKSIEDEKEYWMSKLTLSRISGAEFDALQRKLAALNLAEWKACHQEEVELARKAAEDRKALDDLQDAQVKAHGDASLAIKKEELSTEVELGRMTKAQELATLKNYEMAAYNTEMEVYKQRLEKYKDEPVKYQEMLNKIVALEDKHILQMREINKQIAVDSKATWSNILSPITSAINTSVQGMIMGTTHLRAALRGLGQSIVAEFINDVIRRMVHEWLLGELMKLNISKMYSAIKVALGFAEAAQLISAKEAEAAASQVITSVAGIAEVTSAAAVGAAAAGQSVAWIPYVGWAMVPAVMAETFAMIMAMAPIAAAAGGYDIPKGINPAIQAHGGEMVLPEYLADRVRNMTEAGGRQVNVNFSPKIHAFDSRDVEKALLNSRSGVNRAIRKINRDLNVKIS
jgi:hypothetical protein